VEAVEGAGVQTPALLIRAAAGAARLLARMLNGPFPEPLECPSRFSTQSRQGLERLMVSRPRLPAAFFKSL